MSRLALVLATGVLVFGCQGTSNAPIAPTASPTTTTGTCAPAPLPTPQAAMVSPASGATGVSTNVGALTVQVVSATVASISLEPPSGPAVVAYSVSEVGTPAPTGYATYTATVPALTPNTTYSVVLSGTQTFGGCSQPYASPAGSFSTGT